MTDSRPRRMQGRVRSRRHDQRSAWRGRGRADGGAGSGWWGGTVPGGCWKGACAGQADMLRCTQKRQRGAAGITDRVWGIGAPFCYTRAAWGSRQTQNAALQRPHRAPVSRARAAAAPPHCQIYSSGPHPACSIGCRSSGCGEGARRCCSRPRPIPSRSEWRNFRPNPVAAAYSFALENDPTTSPTIAASSSAVQHLSASAKSAD